MAATEALHRSALSGGDLDTAQSLSDAVGWNQTVADWAIFIGHGRASGIFAQGRLIGTAAILPYGSDFGWVSMVIVAPDWRRQGLARCLMDEAVACLRRDGRAALLDATPAGATVYGGLGFVACGGMERWEGAGGGLRFDRGERAAMRSASLDEVVAADAAAFGADRRFLLGDFLARPGSAALACDGGYLIVRRGRRAAQIGPLIAPSLAVAHHLLAAAMADVEGPVFLDLLEAGNGLAPLLQEAGFRRQRPFLRMALGRDTLPGAPETLFIAAGPEFG